MRWGNVGYLERLATLTPKRILSDSCANVPHIARELTKGLELAFFPELMRKNFFFSFQMPTQRTLKFHLVHSHRKKKGSKEIKRKAVPSSNLILFIMHWIILRAALMNAVWTPLHSPLLMTLPFGVCKTRQRANVNILKRFFEILLSLDFRKTGF